VNRRHFLLATGAGVAGGAAVWAYFNSPGGSAPFYHAGTVEESFAANVEYPTDEDPADGVPPTASDPPAAPDADPSSFETLDVNGESVPLVPIDVAEQWYRRADARFVDARGLDQYTRSHVYGAVCSPAQRGSSGGGIDGWPTGDRIVTYCGCPHHLSSLRAAGLQKAGYAEVYAIDEGFFEWSDRGYPMAGTTFRSESRADVASWTIEGAVDPGHAGAYAWASADRQYEAAPIDDTGAFSLTLHFADVTAETPIEVSTPEFAVRRPLGELAAGPIDGT